MTHRQIQDREEWCREDAISIMRRIEEIGQFDKKAADNLWDEIIGYMNSRRISPPTR